MSDNQRGAATHQIRKTLLDQGFGFRIQTRGRLVENLDPGVAQNVSNPAPSQGLLSNLAATGLPGRGKNIQALHHTDVFMRDDMAVRDKAPNCHRIIVNSKGD